MAPADAGVVGYAFLQLRGSVAATGAGRFGRLALGVCAFSSGVVPFTAVPQTAAMVPGWIPPGQQFWAVATGVFHLLAGVAILSGVLDVLGSRLLTLMLSAFSVLVWAPRLFAQPHEHMVWAGNAFNLAMVGAAWVVDRKSTRLNSSHA